MATPAKRKRVFEHPGRVAVIVIALVVVVNLAIFLGSQSDTSDQRTGGGLPPLPSAIESISPERGDLTGLVDSITVDLDDNYTGDLAIDGITIPEDQLERTEQLGLITFRPGPNKEIS